MADYVIKFNEDGTRGETHDAVFMSAEEVKKYTDQGFIEVSTADYMNLLGNNDANQEYIYKDGKFQPKPVVEPTAEETQAAKLAALDADYGAQLNDLSDQIITAATVDQDTEYADELRKQRQDLQAEYVQKRGEI